MYALNDRERLLVAFGAAFASNCVPCMEKLVPKALEAGLSAGQIREAVQLAEKVRRVPARKVQETALALLGLKPDEEPVGAARPEKCPLEAQGRGGARDEGEHPL